MNSHDLSTLFAQDYLTNEEAKTSDFIEMNHNPTTNSTLESQLYNYEDPLKYSSRIEFEPFQFESSSDVHFVEPHQVNGYIKSDGTTVDTHYRDGDGNPDTYLTKEAGGGYFRQDPGEK
jgi:hypothetical protein